MFLPHSNIVKLDFEQKYYRGSDFRRVNVASVHRQVYPNVYIYMESYNSITQSGRNFSMEKFDDHGKLESKMTANMVRWDTTTNKWGAWWYYIRETDSLGERLTTGRRIDTVLNVGPDDFARSPEFVGTMTHGELIDYIDVLKSQGSDEIKLYLNEKTQKVCLTFCLFRTDTYRCFSLLTQDKGRDRHADRNRTWTDLLIHPLYAVCLPVLAQGRP